jgi:hypothetical protein
MIGEIEKAAEQYLKDLKPFPLLALVPRMEEKFHKSIIPRLVTQLQSVGRLEDIAHVYEYHSDYSGALDMLIMAKKWDEAYYLANRYKLEVSQLKSSFEKSIHILRRCP